MTTTVFDEDHNEPVGSADPSTGSVDSSGQVSTTPRRRSRSRLRSGPLGIVLQRLAVGIPTLLAVSLFIFVLMDLAPTDVAVTIAGEDATLEQIEEVRERLGLNEPVLSRWFTWTTDAVTGDLGTSLVTRQPVTERLFAAVPPTLSLALLALTIAVVVAIVMGSLAAVRPNGWIDKIVTFGAALGITIPSFWLALILINQFAIQRRWLPAVGYVPITEDPVLWLKHLILPALALSFSTMGELARYVRGAMSDSLARDYVLAARAKGLRTPAVILKHALKNAMIPVITVIGVRFATVLGGSVIIEQIFAIRGMGSLVINAVLTQDIPVVLGVAVLATAVVLVVNLLVDLSYGYFNPRLRHR